MKCRRLVFLALSVISFSYTYEITEEWHTFLEQKYKSQQKQPDDFRDFENNAPKRVKEFYSLNHANQTLDFVLRKKEKYCSLRNTHMSVWQAFALLERVIDQSDPDLDLPQLYHALQTAEALRHDDYPRWLILTGFIHDLGKILIAFGEPQWAVVGDTFPVGCAYNPKVIFHSYFDSNPDLLVRDYQTKYGIYEPNCGLYNVHMSWGHDEYLYHVMKNYLPQEALYIIRFHSFYAAHRESAYTHLMDEYDKKMLPLLKLFSQYDLYSKSAEILDVNSLKPFYEELVQEFLPDTLAW